MKDLTLGKNMTPPQACYMCGATHVSLRKVGSVGGNRQGQYHCENLRACSNRRNKPAST